MLIKNILLSLLMAHNTSSFTINNDSHKGNYAELPRLEAILPDELETNKRLGLDKKRRKFFKYSDIKSKNRSNLFHNRNIRSSLKWKQQQSSDQALNTTTQQVISC